jgi:hypothetical protein
VIGFGNAILKSLESLQKTFDSNRQNIKFFAIWKILDSHSEEIAIKTCSVDEKICF